MSIHIHDAQITQVRKALEPWCAPGALQLERTLTSAVTTAWGVDWDETLISRDLMQNFFDANREQLVEVKIQSQGAAVAVTAPAPCTLEKLFFLGSEKGSQDIGQYGEGFKAATTCLLRDHRTTPIVASGKRVVRLRVASQAVADSRHLFPVEYDFYHTEKEIPGTVLVLAGASRDLIAAMQVGLQHFFYEQNPLLGALRWEHSQGHFALYDSTDKNGHVFYRRLKRGQIEGIPLILVINREYAVIERKTRQDRDRKAFGDEMMRTFFDVFCSSGLSESIHALRMVVEAVRPYWERGHLLLNSLADKQRYVSWPAAITAEVFGDQYFARSPRNHDAATQLQCDSIERKWRDAGRIALPSYFRRFGVPTAADEIEKARQEADREARAQGSRGPTAAENACLALLNRVLHNLSPETAEVFEHRTTKYTIAKTDVLLGQLRSSRGFYARDVFFAESVFASEFSHALAVHLHEHSHIFGHDGSRGFTDALTELIETVVLRRCELDNYEAQWNQAREAVRAERAQHGAIAKVDPVIDRVSALCEEELRELLRGVPRGILNRLLNGEGKIGIPAVD